MKKKLCYLLISMLVINFFMQSSYAETLPQTSQYNQIVDEKVKQYFEENITFSNNLQNYAAFGDYLNWSQLRYYTNSRMQLDADGLPKVKYGEDFYYNPVTISQYALSMYGRYLNGEDTFTNFIIAADKLIDLQESNGSFLYKFDYNHPLGKLDAGWVSGMAQGHALSVFARAYKVTNDDKYLVAGNMTFDFLITPVSEGGVMDTLIDIDETLSEYIIFEEYITTPKSYTLNGFLFSLFGLYDWSQLNVDNSQLSGHYFNEGIKTLTKILPLYDIGGITTYDLAHITSDNQPYVIPFYHAVHIYQLHALFTITGEQTLKDYENIFISYVKYRPVTLNSVLMDTIVENKGVFTKGQPITFTANATGGKQLLYQFLVKDGAQWKIVQPYSIVNTYTWTPTESKEYFISVYVKDEDSSKTYDDQKNFKIIIID